MSEPELAAAQVTPRTHLYEVDVLRLLTFACVIAVHTIYYVGGFGVMADGVLMLLHFTRGAFFWLTAFLLTIGEIRRPRPLRSTLPRRFLLVGVPYLVWSAVYVVLDAGIAHTLGHPLALLARYGSALVHADAAEHLYFLVVTMQVYLVLPLLIRAVRRRPGSQPLLLAIGFVVQLAVFGVSAYRPAWVTWTDGYLITVFPSYLFFIVAGVVAGAHADAMLRWVRRHRRALAGAVALTAAATVLVYAVQLHLGMDFRSASNEMQPVQILWGTVVTLGLLAAGSWWADRRRPGRWDDRTVAWASDRSFGIFLSHPAVIIVLLALGITSPSYPIPVRVPIGYVLVVVGAVVITEVSRRTPVSVALTGRRRLRRRRDQPAGANR